MIARPKRVRFSDLQPREDCLRCSGDGWLCEEHPGMPLTMSARARAFRAMHLAVLRIGSQVQPNRFEGSEHPLSVPQRWRTTPSSALFQKRSPERRFSYGRL